VQPSPRTDPVPPQRGRASVNSDTETPPGERSAPERDPLERAAVSAGDTGDEAAATEAEGLPDEVRRRLPSRDPDALERFFDHYFDRLYAYVRGMVRSEHLAEDLTQDIFLLLYRGLPSYDPARALRPWVFTIAINRVRDYWRSRAHRDSLGEASLDEDEGREVEAAGDSPEEPLLRLEDAAAVRAAVDRLSPGMRETVYLRVFEELSFAEIGELLGRNEVAVRKRYSRALEELRLALGAREALDGGGRSS
jgi:RNA polymerase sigma factor (sigma-70 family)